VGWSFSTQEKSTNWWIIQIMGCSLFSFLHVALSSSPLLFVICCFPGVTAHRGCIFHSPVVCFSISKFLDHAQRRATVGRTPLDEWSIRRRDLYPTTHNTDNRQAFMPHNLSTGASEDLRLRPRGHWDRLTLIVRYQYLPKHPLRKHPLSVPYTRSKRSAECSFVRCQ